MIEFLDGISPQAKTISTEGFFPVVGGKLSLKLGPGLLKIASGVNRQQTSPDALPSVLPDRPRKPGAARTRRSSPTPSPGSC